MPLYRVVVLAIVQGLTEFLPVSSSAHLALAPWLLGWKDPGLTFDIALHLGTLAAVVIYFFRAWVQILLQGFGVRAGSDEELRRNPRLLWLLAVGSIPVGIAGYIFKDKAETTWRNPYIVGTMLIVIGLVMWLAEWASRGRKNLAQVNWTDSVLIGASQALAIVPGTSRSGITIAAALFRDLDRPSAARFSFLLATPAIAGAAAKALHDLMKNGGLPQGMATPFLVGVIVSAVTGAIVIAFFIRYLRHGTLHYFIYYRIIFGIIVIALAAFFRAPAG